MSTGGKRWGRSMKRGQRAVSRRTPNCVESSGENSHPGASPPCCIRDRSCLPGLRRRTSWTCWCGKTTQIPQFILDASLIGPADQVANIICTQPRRIFAISMAERVAQERYRTPL
ncbi:hypothetical protein J4Q44_G00005720 [Coregonus suidteri]|uniref:Uncharacterized protein n=1 Tax=Coregonus suidteri TaxID=861788 RepID=A0AAN8RA86_9TELE